AVRRAASQSGSRCGPVRNDPGEAAAALPGPLMELGRRCGDGRSLSAAVDRVGVSASADFGADCGVWARPPRYDFRARLLGKHERAVGPAAVPLERGNQDAPGIAAETAR